MIDLTLTVKIPNLQGAYLTVTQLFNMVGYACNSLPALVAMNGAVPGDKTMQFCQVVSSMVRAEDLPAGDARRWHWYERRLLQWRGCCLSMEMQAGRLAYFQFLENPSATEPIVQGSFPLEYGLVLTRALKTVRAYHLLEVPDGSEIA